MKHPLNYETVYVTTDSKMEDALRALSFWHDEGECFGLDLETTAKEEYKNDISAGLCPYRGCIRLVQISSEDTGKVYVFDVFKLSTKPLWEFIEKGRFFAHNALFEIQFLLKAGVKNPTVYCSMVLYRMYLRSVYPNPGSYHVGLKYMVKHLLKFDIAKEQQTSDWGGKKLTKAQIEYAALDAACCYTCGKSLLQRLMKEAPKVTRINMKALLPVARMMLTGIHVDVAEYLKLEKEWAKERDTYAAECEKIFKDVNLNSVQQLTRWIKENVPEAIQKVWPLTDSGKYFSTSHDTLLEIEGVPGIDVLAKYKKYQKLTSTYGEKLLKQINPVTKRLHGSYTLGHTTTGRLSAREPNLQNLPRDKNIRNKFVSQYPTTTLLCADYSQIELRCAAILSNDKRMLSAYREGIDLHRLTAATMSGKTVENVTAEERQMAKAVNFGLLFGMGADKLRIYARVNYGVEMSPSEAMAAVEAFRDTYPDYREWQLAIANECSETLKVTTPSGLLRRLTTTNYYPCSMNTPIQGSAAEIALCAITRIDEETQKSKAMIRQINVVHDEFLLEVHKKHLDVGKKILHDCMVAGYKDIFPDGPDRDLVEVGEAREWGNAKK